MFRPRAPGGLYAPAGHVGDDFVVKIAAWTLEEGEGVGGIMARKRGAESTGCIGRQLACRDIRSPGRTEAARGGTIF